MDQNEASKKVLSQSQETKFPYIFDFEKLSVVIHKHVFSPKFFNGWRFFTKHFPDVSGKTVLEVGCGTGITSLYLATHGAKEVLATDINPYAVINTQENIERNKIRNMQTRESDIFSRISKEESFDIIYWNMPFMYQPEGYEYSSILERGLFDPGYNITKEFIKEAEQYLNKGGELLIGTGDFGDINKMKEIAQKNNYTVSLIAKEDSEEINPVDFQLYKLTK